MRRVFHVSIKDAEGFDRRQGWVLAEDEQRAREIAGNPKGLRVVAKHSRMVWPGPPGEELAWAN